VSTLPVTLEELIQLHEIQINLFKSLPGIKDIGRLEASVARPKAGYFSDEIEEAAVLWHAIMTNHGFNDGNKRVAYQAMKLYLYKHQIIIKIAPQEAESFLMCRFNEHNLTHENLTKFLRFHLEKND